MTYLASPGFTASFVAMDPRTGHVKAMMKGSGFADSQFNIVTDGIGRQMGSTWKVITLATVLANNYSAEDKVDGTSPCSVKGFDGQTRGFVVGRHRHGPGKNRGQPLGHGLVPSGASTGCNEALELRDGDPARFRGRSVFRAIENIRREIAAALEGWDVADQVSLDRRLIELDGTPNKSRLGANAVLGVSMAVARAVAAAQRRDLFDYLGNGAGTLLPLPEIQLFGGGRHANGRVDVQDFMIVATGQTSGGNQFRRERLVHINIATAVDSTLRFTQFRIEPLTGGVAGLTRFRAFVRPQDALGNLLGPGFAGTIKIEAPGAVALTPQVQDDLVGGYFHDFQFNPATTSPVVQVSVGDATLPPQIVGPHLGLGGFWKAIYDAFPWLASGLCAGLLLILVIVLLIWLIIIH